MPSVVKRIFNAGELSPKVYARTDLAKWEGGAKTMLNTIPLPQGGTVRRPAFEYIANAKNNNVPVKLIPFQFSTVQAYMIEAGNGYMRFYKDGGQIQTIDANTSLLLHFDGPDFSTTIVDDGNNNHACTAEGSSYLSSARVWGGNASFWSSGIATNYVSIPDHADWTPAGNFTIAFWLNPSVTPLDRGFFSQEVDANNYCDLSFNNSSNNLNYVLRSAGNNLVAMSANFSPQNNTWYHIAVIRGWNNNANEWALTINGNLAANATADNAYPNFAANLHIGVNILSQGARAYIDEFIWYQGALFTENFNVPQQPYPEGGNIGTVYNLNTSYNAAELADLQYTQSYDTIYLTHKNHAPAKLTRTAHNNWNLQNISFGNNSQPAEWSNNNGWPRTCAFYQDRLVFASTTSLPSRLWFSKTGNYEDLTTGANDDDGFVLNLLSGSSDVIFWLASGKRLICGTDAGIQSIAAATGSNTALTPTNKFNKKESYFGAGEIFPVKLGDIVVYAGNPASKVRELAYSWEADGYKSSELTVLADHLLEGYTVREFAYQQSPYEIVWCRRNDNTLLALTYLQQQEVVAWSRHVSGNVASVAVIPGPTESELWAAIHRNINNNTVTFIERLREFKQVPFNNSFFLDAGLQYSSGNNVSVVTGLDHLNGNNVTYLADGVIGTATIANNNLTLNNAAAIVSVGIPYNSDLEPLPVDFESREGPTMFQTKRLTEIAILARNSAGGTYGPDSGNQTALFANNALINNAKVNLSLRGGYDHTRTVFIRQSDPLPLNIDAIGFEVEI